MELRSICIAMGGVNYSKHGMSAAQWKLTHYSVSTFITHKRPVKEF